VTFLVPVLTPSFFSSDQCRRELRRFLDRERRLGRRDLILPVYWIGAALLEDPARRARDDLAQELATRQYTDWRELRFQQLTDPQARRALAVLAAHLRDALDPAGK
jgi:F-box protein 11